MNVKSSREVGLRGSCSPGRARKTNWASLKGTRIIVTDDKTGQVFQGSVRIKAVRCGKPTCKKCPHYIYAYARFRDGKRVREKYLGIAR